jgi:tetratricopeptide (TPR) repeat protein
VKLFSHGEPDGDKITNLKQDLKIVVKEAINYKAKGNESFNKQTYDQSIEYYHKALLTLNLTPDYKELLSQTNIDSIKVECLNNIAICYLIKQKDYDKVLEFTEQALKLQKKNYKALYIKSRALKKLSRWEDALEVIKMVSF